MQNITSLVLQTDYMYSLSAWIQIAQSVGCDLTA